MPHIFQPTTTKPIPAKAKPFTRAGKPWVKWKPYRPIAGVEWIEGEVLPNGKCRVTSPTWWVKWTDAEGIEQKEPVGLDYREAEVRAAELVQQLYRQRLGQETSPLALEQMTLTELAGDYRAHLEALGREAKHCRQTETQILSVADDCSWTTLRDVNLGGWTKWVGRNWNEDGYNASTINHYLRSWRGLLRWLIKSRRLIADPLIAAELLNEDADRRLIRRVISGEEFRKLIDHTRASDGVRFHLDGPSRAALYLIAGRTGLRVGTLARMRPNDIKLDDTIPHIPIEAGKRIKNRKRIEIPLAPNTVAELRPWLVTRPATQLLWPGPWYNNNDAAEMLRTDLKAVGLEPTTHDGAYDFHALRSQCGTDLARAGVPLTVVQKILGHSTPELTAKLYSRHGLSDLAAAVGKLEIVEQAEREAKEKAKEQRQTG